MATRSPTEIPQGAIRFNTDSQKMEFYAQDQWWEMATDVPTLDGGARGFVSGGLSSGSEINNIDMITIPTTGNAIDFGNLTQQSRLGGTCASRTRAIRMGGIIPGPSITTTIDYWTMSKKDDAVSFSTLETGQRSTSGLSNETRGICAAGVPDNEKIQYITIASLGAAKDFGNLSQNRTQASGISNPTRGLFAGGEAPSRVNTIDYINIASTGNAHDFGDITREISGIVCVGNSTRGMFGAGEFPSTFDSTIDYVTIATKGNASHFGELTFSYRLGGTASSPIRGVFMGGTNDSPSSNTVYNTIQYITLASEGNAVDFGDLTTSFGYAHIGNCSNAHGGL
tara:strand:+ start:1615 stop:2634 length:1020 start_codon:yes stop_codon:yes gene_type:complete